MTRNLVWALVSGATALGCLYSAWLTGRLAVWLPAFLINVAAVAINLDCYRRAKP